MSISSIARRRLIALSALALGACALTGCQSTGITSSGWSYHEPSTDTSTDTSAPQPAAPTLTSVRLESIESNPVQQTSGTSCWAAAAEMVFRYNDANTKQDQFEIAKRMGRVVEQNAQGKTLTEAEQRRAIEAAGQIEVMLALYPEYKVDPDRLATNAIAWMERGGDMRKASEAYLMKGMMSWLRGQTVRASEIGSALQPKGKGKPQPIIVGFSQAEGSEELGHICVITGIDYAPSEPTAFGRVTEGTWISNATLTISPGEIYTIHYADPWDKQIKSKSAQEFLKEADFIITREIAIAAIGGLDKAVMPAGQSGVPEGGGFFSFLK